MHIDPTLLALFRHRLARMQDEHRAARELSAMRDAERPDQSQSQSHAAHASEVATRAANHAEYDLVEAMLVAGMPAGDYYTGNLATQVRDPIGIVAGDTLWLALDQERWPSGVTESKPDGEHHMMFLHAIPIGRLVGLVPGPAADAEGGV